MKHIPSSLLGAAILAFVPFSKPLAATAETADQFGDFTYSSDGTNVTITGYTGNGDVVSVPTTIAGLPVTAIGDSAFAENTNLTTVIISTGVGDIGLGAFFGCAKLTDITIPAGVTNIETGAFSGCASLMTIDVEVDNAFYSSVDGVLFDKGQTTLHIFPGAAGGSYSIPTNVTTIAQSAFSTCAKLTSVTIPESVTNIRGDAFSGCASLTNITIPIHVTEIREFTFSGCTSLAHLSIPGNVRSIGDFAFGFCSNLTGVVISEGVTSIWRQAFYRCDILTNMVLPRSLMMIVIQPFPTGPNLKGLFFKGNAPAVFGVFELATNTTVYYLPGATGWGKTFGGVRTGPWDPLIQTTGPNFGVRTNHFGFNITGATNIPIVIEATTDLNAADWVALQSLELTNGLFYFRDPGWTNFPARIYRIRSP